MRIVAQALPFMRSTTKAAFQQYIRIILSRL
jgi:hypothetical protein